MRVLHLAPHYGGGVGTSVVGIIEAIPGTHTLLALENTLDTKSILFTSRKDFNLVKLENFFSDSIKQSTDLFILHYWNSPVWEKLKEYAKFQIVGKLILLHHRNFKFSGHEVQSLAKHFSKVVQSGFESRLLPSDWETVPTCRTLSPPKSIRNICDRSGAVYLGTLSFKKVADDFFYFCEKLDSFGVSVEIWGKKIDTTFTKAINSYRKSNVTLRGYADNALSVLARYKFLLYPLTKNHFGTTENSLLEAMCVGTVPIIHDNVVERFILGEELSSLVSLDNAFAEGGDGIIQSTEVQLKASKLAQQRAQSLTRVELRASKWKAILSHKECSVRELSIESLSRSLARFF